MDGSIWPQLAKISLFNRRQAPSSSAILGRWWRRRVDIWKEHGLLSEKIAAHGALSPTISGFFEDTYLKIMNPQDRLFNRFHRKHNSFQTLNRILETKDLIWFLGVLNTLWCLQGDLYLMARALLKCIWFTETEFVFNKKQTF